MFNPHDGAILKGDDDWVAIPLIVIGEDGGLLETGETVDVPITALDSRTDRLAAVITGGGPSPHIINGDQVVFEAGDVLVHGQLAVVAYGRLLAACWTLQAPDGAWIYQQQEGVRLPPDLVRMVGRVTLIMRAPPSYEP